MCRGFHFCRGVHVLMIVLYLEAYAGCPGTGALFLTCKNIWRKKETYVQTAVVEQHHVWQPCFADQLSARGTKVDSLGFPHELG